VVYALDLPVRKKCKKLAPETVAGRLAGNCRNSPSGLV